MICDLHTHTNLSDGGTFIEDLIQNAIKDKIEILSITDHNIFEAYKNLKENNKIKIIKGIEISVKNKDEIYHFLMYDFNLDNQQLLNYEKKVREYDIKNFKNYVNLLVNEYNFQVDENELNSFINKNVYFDKVRLNNLLVQLKISKTPKEAFYDYTHVIKENPRYCISLDELFELEKNTNSIVSLAHPTNYFSSLKEIYEFIIFLKDNYNLRAVEAITSRASVYKQRKLIEFCNSNNLLISGGSDFHAKYGEVENKKLGKANGIIKKEKLTILKLF